VAQNTLSSNALNAMR